MTTGQNGLRFDIYERVHLSEGVLGIKELEGVELVPHIQVLPQGEQAVLRGNLLLSGTYMDEQEREAQRLEHLIPVEITLPMNRVQRVEDIAVEIENFDVDLLSSRSLNVTGVLSLNGLEVISAADNESWREAEEEVVFVHEAGDRRFVPEPESEPVVYASPPLAQQEQAPQQAADEIFGDLTLLRQEQAQAAEPQQDYRSEPVINEEPSIPVNENAEFIIEPSVPIQENKEVRIGLSSKKVPEDPPEAVAAPAAKSFGIASLINSAAARRADARSLEELDPAAAAQAAAERVEWKNLLLSSKTQVQEFKRMRLCIVQKEETLESIAKRYEMNPREIALYNRLGDSGVSQGQIVLIPRS
ncbi:LysM peptidoglycan-binding domain-containing protein [Paenibacillus cremeus]|uniref:LysM peptidoglycan-binding domain-containing protein n=1 Tax=Paenibacillus cremeus TaxID=2163881 RepID=A0A559KIE1_9BACL|nr:LysM peptidoglycan-binding domain-containing protein [Paenibacillus cremeus]TVY11895.1 LysM peptidoglycan-binding domain-containing protein [Paenibacillus cremeus]